VAEAGDHPDPGHRGRGHGPADGQSGAVGLDSLRHRGRRHPHLLEGVLIAPEE